ncbi:N-acetylmuramoyl-L-alanine amidase [Teredinibacter turnerae]|uniref:peptidoglycan recognition protein family protein n=1 Tax=Teredinibacter turnerae TaxID=2426 RepID=UPI00035CCFC9|nr:N-acetylmuramoyl-L-alanine amidase [Teredinibacter turnerae]
MSKLINGELQDPKVQKKIYKSLHKGKISTVNAIVVHQTGAPSAEHTFNSYTGSANGAHFLIDKQGQIYQTALTTQITYHVGRVKSRCIEEPKSCTTAELTAANVIYLQKGISYSVRVKNLHNHEKAKSYPDRYPTNADSVGIEIVGSYNTKTQAYETVNAKQNASLKWLASELSTHLSLQAGDVYRHPSVSYKQASEASTASW